MLYLIALAGCRFDVDFALGEPPDCGSGSGPPSLSLVDGQAVRADALIIFGPLPLSRIAFDLDAGSVDVRREPGVLGTVVRLDGVEPSSFVSSIEPVGDTLELVSRCPDADCPSPTFTVQLATPVDGIAGHTDAGDIRIRETARQRVDVSTGLGAVAVTGDMAEVRAFATADVDLDLPAAVTVDVVTPGGATVRGTVRDRVCAETDGRLEVELGSTAEARLTAGLEGVAASFGAAPSLVHALVTGNVELAVPPGRYAIDTSAPSHRTVAREPAILPSAGSDRSIVIVSLEGDIAITSDRSAP